MENVPYAAALVPPAMVVDPVVPSATVLFALYCSVMAPVRIAFSRLGELLVLGAPE